MIRAFRAIVWLRWRLLFNSIQSGRRRDALEQVSRIFAAIVPALFLALSLGTVAAVSVLGFLGGRAVATGLVEPGFLAVIVRLTLLVVFGLLFIITVAAPGQTTLSRYKRLLLMPIPRQTLHVTEVVANLADPWLGFVIPGLILFAVGMVVGGKSGAGAIALAAAAGIMAVFACMAALISFLVGWLLRSRRRGEAFTLIFILAVSLVSIVPALLSKRLEDRESGRRFRETLRSASSVQEIDRALPGWTRVLPSELYGRAILAGVERRTSDAWTALGVLGLEAAVLFAFSSVAHRKLIESVESDSRRRRAAARSASWRLPLAGPAVSAIAITEFRTAMRSVRGRLAVLLPGPLVAVLTLGIGRVPDDRQWLAAVASQGHITFAVSLLFALYAIQPFSMNLFGTDRSGLTRLFLAPATDVELARGKVAGCGLLFATAGCLCLIGALLVAPTGPVSYWIATVLGAMATYALLTPIAVFMSALFPVAADMSKTGAGGNPHPLPMLAGTVIVVALAAPAAAVFLVNWVWIRQPVAVVMLMIVWLAVTIVTAVPILALASRAIGARRENLALIAQGR